MMNDQKKFDKNIAKITKVQWQKLFKLIPIIQRTKKFGQPVSEKNSDGTLTFPYVQKSKIVTQFNRTVYDIGIIHPFDWANWDKGKKLFRNPKTDFNKLDIKTLCMLITAIVRYDRFCDGALVDAFERGVIQKILNSLKTKIKY